MKRLLMTTAGAFALAMAAQPVLAADIPVAPAYKAPVVAPMFNWTGFYAGGHVGYGWGRSATSSPDSVFDFGSGSISAKTDGWLGGGQVGYNYQSGNLVFGLEGDFSWAGIDGRGTVGPNFVTADYKSLATIAARLGYAFDRTLIYAKGGFGFADVTNFATDTSDTLDTTRRSGWVSGYALGGGLEYAVDPAWSLKLEYLYFNFNDKRSTNSDTDIYTHKNRIHTVKLGFNYRFATGKAPVMANY